MNQAKSWKQLFALIGNDRFSLTKNSFLDLHALVAKEEALHWGKFRDEQVTIAGTGHAPPPAQLIDEIFDKGLLAIGQIKHPHERAIVFFLFGSLNQFFWDGNKRTSRLMMNGILLSNGYDVINIPAVKKLEFNQKMIRFYDDLDGTEMIDFMVHCSLDSTLRIGKS